MARLEDICSFLSGNAWSASKFCDGEPGVPIVRIQNLGENENEKFVYWRDSFDEKFIVTDGDILLSLSGSIKLDVWKGGQALLNQRIVKITPDKNIDKNYLLYKLSSLVNEITRSGRHALVNNVSINDVKSLEIPLPDLKIQQKIASILAQADAARQKRKQANQLTEQFLQSAFLEMFGDPVRNEKGWKVKRLKEISTKIHSGNTPKGGSAVYIEQGITFFRSQNVWRNRLDMDDIAYIDIETHRSMMKSSLMYGDILMTKTGRFNTENSSLGRAALYLGDDNQANVNGHVYLIRLRENVIRKFVLYILTTNQYRDYIRSVCVGGIDKRQLNKEHLENFPIVCPPVSLQQKFAALVEQTERLRTKQRESERELDNLFQSLMQKYFG